MFVYFYIFNMKYHFEFYNNMGMVFPFCNLYVIIIIENYKFNVYSVYHKFCKYHQIYLLYLLKKVYIAYITGKFNA